MPLNTSSVICGLKNATFWHAKYRFLSPDSIIVARNLRCISKANRSVHISVMILTISFNFLECRLVRWSYSHMHADLYLVCLKSALQYHSRVLKRSMVKGMASLQIRRKIIIQKCICNNCISNWRSIFIAYFFVRKAAFD